MVIEMVIAIGIINICLLPFAFFFGLIYERAAWNKLITKGVIPKPKKFQND